MQSPWGVLFIQFAGQPLATKAFARNMQDVVTLTLGK